MLKENYSIMHIYSKTKVLNGGIESQILDACDIAEKAGMPSKWVDEGSFLKWVFANRNAVPKTLFMVHGVLPKTVLVFAIAILFCGVRRTSLWMPHFHPPEFTKRPIAVGLYMAAVRLLFAFIKTVKIVVYSESQKQAFGRYFRGHSITVLPFGLREEKFSTTSDALEKRVAATPVYDAIYICRSDKIKRRDLYIALAQKHSDQKFCLITDGPVTPLDNLDVFYSVPHDELVSLLLSSRFFVSASLYESYGLAIAEAEFHGLPALARRQTGYFDQFDKNEFPAHNLSLVYDDDDDFFVKWNALQAVSDEMLYQESLIMHFHRRAIASSFEKSINAVIEQAANQGP